MVPQDTVGENGNETCASNNEAVLGIDGCVRTAHAQRDRGGILLTFGWNICIDELEGVVVQFDDGVVKPHDGGPDDATAVVVGRRERYDYRNAGSWRCWLETTASGFGPGSGVNPCT